MLDAVTVVDAHVHVHPGTEAGALLDSAARNLAAVATEIGAQTWQGVLMLAEMRGTDWFGSTRRRAPQAPGWSIEPVADDPASLSATKPGVDLTIIAGRQVVTAEGIEVLALATTAGIDDGLSLADTISAAVGHGALVVLPWGAGKWLGLRGRLVGEAVAAGTQPVFVGDNGGRPSFWPEPAVFGGAHAKGRPVLSGTDPLPLPGEERRVGSFGFWLHDSLTAEAPSRSLRERLLGASADNVFRFGHLQGAVRFLKSQVQLRMRKGNAVRG
jgi:hypothetical protein